MRDACLGGRRNISAGRSQKPELSASPRNLSGAFGKSQHGVIRYNNVLTKSDPEGQFLLMKTTIRRVGNSKASSCQSPLISQLNLGTEVDLDVEGDKIVLRKPRRRARVVG